MLPAARGAAKPGGISFCYPSDFTAEELDLYARNFPLPLYLSFLDAVSAAWTAPDWLYEITERLPFQVRTIPY